MARHLPNAANKPPKDNNPAGDTEGEDKDDVGGDGNATPGIETETSTLESLTKKNVTVPGEQDLPDEFIVTNPREVRVLYSGCLATFAPGKIVSSAAYDIDALRKQGVMLEPRMKAAAGA